MLKSIYCDGGCKGVYDVDQVGAWAYVVLDGFTIDIESEPSVKKSGLTLGTTNNRTEMLAVINAIASQPKGSKLRIYSDSGYVVNGINNPSYLKKWRANGWKTSKKTPVENQDLWREMIKLIESDDYELRFILVKGHGKNKDDVHNKFNSMVDVMCTEVMNNYIGKRDAEVKYA